MDKRQTGWTEELVSEHPKMSLKDNFYALELCNLMPGDVKMALDFLS